MKKFNWILLGAGAVMFLSGCGSNSSDSDTFEITQIDFAAIQQRAEEFVPQIGTPGGEIRLTSISDPKSFNPITSIENTTSEFTSLMYEGLVRINRVTLLPEPGLAQSWEISDDGLTYIFTLREGIKWSDGTPISAYDVDFTFNQLIYNLKINPNNARDMFMIDGNRIEVTALDSSRVKCVLPHPFAPFLRAMSQEILPKHVHQPVVEAGNFPTSLGIQTPPGSMVVNGKFMLESYTSSQQVVFRRNPHYWKKDAQGNQLPYLERVVYTIVADQSAQLLNFMRGRHDYYAARGEDYPGLKRAEKRGNFTVHRLGPSKGSNFLMFNQNQGTDASTGRPYVDSAKLSWFSNPNFRRAVAHAIDKQRMINNVMNGLGYPQWSPMTPSEGLFFNPDVAQYPYDKERALEILEAEGFSDKNDDGYLQDRDGNTVEFAFITNSGNSVRLRIAEIIRRDLQELGMKVHFQQLDFNTMGPKINNAPYDWDAVLLALSGGDEPHFGRNVWHSTGSLHMWNLEQPSPSTLWQARIDSIFDSGVKILDLEERRELYNEWQRIAADKLPLIYTVLPETIICLTNRFGNVNPSLSGGLLHNLEYLYVK
ncbi:Oligopeptide ABC transporter, periplasmic oligopeptide-binding protein OppA [Chitinispirillum alkaliphilum]|nr:Oligopeptide ABC transporter, periplasmic oligopeptide-binding protein OppA [Chitinispirillum alkaliphilum]